MRVEHRLAVLDLVGETADGDRVPSLSLGDRARRQKDLLLASSELPALPFLDAQLTAPSVSLDEIALAC
jgi:hypothetical protein